MLIVLKLSQKSLEFFPSTNFISTLQSKLMNLESCSREISSRLLLFSQKYDGRMTTGSYLQTNKFILPKHFRRDLERLSAFAAREKYADQRGSLCRASLAQAGKRIPTHHHFAKW